MSESLDKPARAKWRAKSERDAACRRSNAAFREAVQGSETLTMIMENALSSADA
jgi:hypothetical protein